MNTAVLRSSIWGGGREKLGEGRYIKERGKREKCEGMNRSEGKGKKGFHTGTSFSHFQSCVCASD